VSYDIGVRMRALRAMAGYGDMKQLAERLTARGNGRGLKTKTLRSIEQGVRAADYRELREIAEACEMPVEWFTADFARLAKISDDARTVVAKKKQEWAALQEPDGDPDHPKDRSLHIAQRVRWGQRSSLSSLRF
jgi:transcriptional regulator with XRE-family HTH domain